MTRVIATFFCMMLFVVHAACDIVVQIPTGYQNQLIQGSIAITHQPWQEVDDKSFAVDGKPFAVTKIGDTVDANNIVLSRYTFTLPGKQRGLYLFPAVRVQVGDSMIYSAPVSYEVVGSENASLLQLDARVKEKGPFYPGQKVTFQYLITFKNPVQLTKEQLPLLEFPGFRTVGAPKIENLPQGDNTVQVISQQAVAQEAGTFSSGPSLIEGYIYGQDAYGNRVTSQTPIQAQAQDVQITVSSFPKEGMPRSFNGAIGVFYWSLKTIGATNVTAGEKLTLQVLVSGSGDIDTVRFPDLEAQKGFKEQFRLSDLAPVGEVKEGKKIFTVILRPLSSNVKQIPSIEFSSFDPISKTYVVKKTDPIAITVRPGKGQDDGSEARLSVLPIEVQSNIMLAATGLQVRRMQNILLVYAAILLTAILAAQVLFHKLWLASQAQKLKSRDIILDAIKQKQHPDICCQLLRKALLLRLYEAGITTKPVELPEELAQEGLQGDIRALLVGIEKKRFMGLETQLEITEIINEATQLYYRMK